MKRSLLLLVLMGLFLNFSFTHYQKTDLEKSGIFGKVKSIRETNYSVSNKPENNSQENIVLDNLTSFNLDGDRQKKSEYKDGVLFSYITYKYDHKNVLAGSDEYNADNSLYLSISYSSNDKGFVTDAHYNRILQKTYDNDRLSIAVEYDKYYQNLFTHVFYKNDFKGNVLEEKYFTGEGNLSYKLTYKYDYKYNKVEIKYYNKSGNLSWRKKLKYDSKGNKTESKFFESNRLAMVSKYVYEFDQNDNWVKRVEARKLYYNFFATDLNDNSIITIREIEYY